MKRKPSGNPRPRRRRSRGPFRPLAPVIVYGKFEGKRVDELSAQELTQFIGTDAQHQVSRPFSWRSVPIQHISDYAPYWCARFELETAKPGRTIEIEPMDSVTKIAEKMVNFAFRRASLKGHPDVGGTDEVQKRIKAARDMLLQALKRSR